MKIDSGRSSAEQAFLFQSMGLKDAKTPATQEASTVKNTFQNSLLSEEEQKSLQSQKRAAEKAAEEAAAKKNRVNKENSADQVIESIKSGENFADAIWKMIAEKFELLFEEALEANGGNVEAAIVTAKTQVNVDDQNLLAIVQDLAGEYKNINGEISEQLSDYAEKLLAEIEQKNSVAKTLKDNETEQENIKAQMSLTPQIQAGSLQYPKTATDFYMLFQRGAGSADNSHTTQAAHKAYNADASRGQAQTPNRTSDAYDDSYARDPIDIIT